jgi:hypothetical protein
MLIGRSGILREPTIEEALVRPGALMTSVVAAHAVRRKGEDGLRVERRLIGGDVVLCAVVVDGHAGHQAALFVVDHIIEFICEESFRPRICLVQVATPERVALIDPLEGVDPRPIYEVAADPAVTTLVHAGEQDIGAVRDAIGRSIENVVDTQIAVSMIGLPWPSSLGTTLETFVGLRLGKAHTFTEWDRRPLTASQLHYAADDVRYLPMAWDAVRRQLESCGRLQWVLQESAAQLAGESEFDPERQMRRASRGEPLRPAATTLLRELVPVPIASACSSTNHCAPGWAKHSARATAKPTTPAPITTPST